MQDFGVALMRANEWPAHIAKIFTDYNATAGYLDDVQRHYVGYVNGEPCA